MTRENLLQKYNELSLLADEKDKQISNICYNWEVLRKKYSDVEIEMMIENLEIASKDLRTQANAYFSQYAILIEQDRAKYQAIIDAKKSVKKQFGTSPDDIVITGGVLSSNASQSHLIGRSKTASEIEQEKNQLLDVIKSRAMAKEITLAEASKMAQEVNIAYGTDVNVNSQGGMKR